jgi:hypothetical protein
VKIVFLSFSKCAGVAIRNAITRNNPHLRMPRAWGRSHACRYTITQLNTYDFFAGHYDWSDLDCLEGDRFTFTVLRPPVARALSQYCHWRDRAARTATDGAVLKPEQQEALQLLQSSSPRDFFQKLTQRGHGEIRDLFDHLYTYFFFYRGYHGRRFARMNGIPMTRVFDMALDNIAHIDYVATFANLHDDMREVEKLSGLRFTHDLRVEHPTIYGAGTDRAQLAGQLDPSGYLAKQLQQFVAFDAMLYDMAVARPFGRARRLPVAAQAS